MRNKKTFSFFLFAIPFLFSACALLSGNSGDKNHARSGNIIEENESEQDFLSGQMRPVNADRGAFSATISAFESGLQQGEIIDFEGNSEGKGLPEWVEAYLMGGEQNAEWSFAGNYVFVAEMSAPSLDLVKKWSAHFSLQDDFPRLVFLRVERRLRNMRYARSAGPYQEFGPFYEKFLRACADGSYTGAVKAGDCWIFREAPPPPPPAEAEGETEEAGSLPEGGLYTALILVTMRERALQDQLRALIEEVRNGPVRDAPTRQQISAFLRLGTTLFEGF